MVSFQTAEVYNEDQDNIIGVKVKVSADNGQVIDEIQVTNKTELDELKAKLDALGDDYVKFDDESQMSGLTIDEILTNISETININATTLNGIQSDGYAKTSHTHLKSVITDLYNYSIGLSNYNVELGDNVTVTVNVTNQSGTPVSGQQVIIYKNGSVWKTGTTNNNGVYSTTYKTDAQGLITFGVNNQKVQCNVKIDTGWVSLLRTNTPYFVFNSKLEARRIGNIVHIRGAVKTISTVPFMGWDDYWAIGELPDERFYANAPEMTVFQCSGKQRCMGRVLSGSGGTISIGRFTNANTEGEYTLFNNAGIEVSMTYYVD